MPSNPTVDVTQLPESDRTSLCALKLMVEVEVGPLTAFEVAEAGGEQWQIDYLKSGPGLIGPDVVDTTSLGRARAWHVEVGRQRRMASLRGERLPQLPAAKPRVVEHQQTAWKVPQAKLSESGIKACAAFEALAEAEESTRSPAAEWLDVSEFVPLPLKTTMRPSRPDSVIVIPVVGAPGFVPAPDVWSLSLDVTATQMQPA
jgi:hypothetical protein